MLDIARDVGLDSGLVAADAALHERVTTHRELAAVLRAQWGWPGSRRARLVVQLADAATESPLESLTRLCLVTRQVPPPLPQKWIYTSRGWFRVDFLWPAERVIVEADGMIKYRPGWQVMVAQRLREEALERAGFEVLRVFWEDVVRYPDETAARVDRTLRERR